jgi:hypothetical protein
VRPLQSSRPTASPWETVLSATWRNHFLDTGRSPSFDRAMWKRAAVERCRVFKIDVKNGDAAEAVGIAMSCETLPDLQNDFSEGSIKQLEFRSRLTHTNKLCQGGWFDCLRCVFWRFPEERVEDQRTLGCPQHRHAIFLLLCWPSAFGVGLDCIQRSPAWRAGSLISGSVVRQSRDDTSGIERGRARLPGAASSTATCGAVPVRAMSYHPSLR